MFGFSDLISLIISAFIILPTVIFVREMGYLIVSEIFGVENPRLTIGSGPRVFKFGIFDVRKYYHLYSWYSYDSLKRKSNFAYVCIYAAPILINIALAMTINLLLAYEVLQSYQTFWDRFIFYAFYYVLFDIVPMKTANGKPNNGFIIYEMLRYGRRTDYNEEPFIPATTDVEKEYEEEMERIEEIKEHQKEEVEEDHIMEEDKSREEKEQEKREIEEEEKQKKQELKEQEKEEKEEQRDRKKEQEKGE